MIGTPQTLDTHALFLAETARQEIEEAGRLVYPWKIGEAIAGAAKKAMRALIPKGTKGIPAKHNLPKLLQLLHPRHAALFDPEMMRELRPYQHEIRYTGEAKHSAEDLKSIFLPPVERFVKHAEASVKTALGS